MKTCVKCKIEKESSEYLKDKRNNDGLYSFCKECWREYQRNYQREHKLEKYTVRNREYQREYSKTRKYRDYINNRRKYNISFKLAESLRKRLNIALKKNYKAGSAIKDLGCSVDNLKKYLESKFSNGMGWENYGVCGWHIDHIIPLSSFDLSDREQLLLACNYKNLQPLWAADNISKGNKI